MKKIAWLTDIHLNFLPPDAVRDFLVSIRKDEPDCVLLTGDIAESDTLEKSLMQIEGFLNLPVYFVLGNHDFYRSSIAEVREVVRILCAKRKNLHYLTQEGVIELTPTTALVGHDGWGDGLEGDYEGSSVVLSDFLFIKELFATGKAGRRSVLEELGQQAADHLQTYLTRALDSYRHVIVAVHVPPFTEASMRDDGENPREHVLPYYTCGAVGELLLDTMKSRVDNKVTVLCGHTHTSANAKVLPNLRVVAGGVKYGYPRVQQIIEIRPRG